MVETKVRQALRLLEEAGRLDLLSSGTLPRVRPAMPAAASVAAAVFSCSPLHPGNGAGNQVSVQGRLRIQRAAAVQVAGRADHGPH
ncbi:hypothetical protein NDU88_003182 [Pleurodeles waltl]|uniref:Uncharacterized protein n=1 Tax=Pleurodeles waltl TaxID=8319 RepID=A0AAV7LEL5_PLEWA|nr:hypothetical protein NDU88_003182 [Pleurodeles waltl]